MNLGKLRNASLEGSEVPEDVRIVAQRYIDNVRTCVEKGYGLLLYGTEAAGKSYVASAILRAAAKKRYSCMMISAAKLSVISGMKSNHPFDDRETWYERVCNVHILVIDGLGSEKRSQSGFTEKAFLDLLRHRVGSSNTSTIITSRLSPVRLNPNTTPAFERIYGTEFQSLLDEVCLLQRVEGTNYREVLQAEMVNLLRPE